MDGRGRPMEMRLYGAASAECWSGRLCFVNFSQIFLSVVAAMVGSVRCGVVAARCSVACCVRHGSVCFALAVPTHTGGTCPLPAVSSAGVLACASWCTMVIVHGSSSARAHSGAVSRSCSVRAIAILVSETLVDVCAAYARGACARGACESREGDACAMRMQWCSDGAMGDACARAIQSPANW